MPRRFVLALLVACPPIVGLGQEEDLSKELPRIPAVEPGSALKTITLHEGFQLEQVACEPIVLNPVSAVYDADGRLYVAEMRDYPFPGTKPPGDVALLEDTDGDGRFDRRVVFLEGLAWPTSVLPYDGGVFVTCAPDLFYAKDTDGDGKADLKRTVFTGFGTQNVQALLNGLLWGPDGWIHGVGGGNGGDITSPERPAMKAVSVRGRDFRFKPDGSAFEAISGGGQFGHSFDDWYHRFTCNNSNSIRQIVLPADAIERNPALAVSAVLTDIDVEGGAGPVFRLSQPEPWRVVRTRQRLADPAIAKKLSFTERFAFGYFTSATGVTIYRGTSFPPEYRGNAFVGDVGGNLVHRKLLDEHGALYQARRADPGREFLASTDNWFRPVNFANTPDGCLLILDMYRETIEHPFSIPEPIKKHLDLTSGKDRGRLYKLVPKGFQERPKPALSKASTAELVKHLADPDAWFRETAQRLLIERGAMDAIPLLKQMAEARPSALGRAHALWALDALGGLGPAEVVLGLRDEEPRVREMAARLTQHGQLQNDEVLSALIGLANDPDSMVRFETALALGSVPVVRGDDERAGRLSEALATIARQDAADPWTRLAVQTSLREDRALAFLHALVGGGARRTVDFTYLNTDAGRGWLEAVAALIGAWGQPEPIAAVLTDYAAGPGSTPETTRALILGLGRGLRRSGGSLRSIASRPEGACLRPVFEQAAVTADKDGPLPARIEAARLLGLGPADFALGALPDLLDARQPTALQLAALQGLAEQPDPRIGPTLIEHWKALGPALRNEAAEALLARTERVRALLDAIEAREVLAADLDPARRAQLLAHRDPGIRERASKLLGDVARVDRAPVIAKFRPALEMAGEVDRGREQFKKSCITCHKAEGQGNEVGPDLATITNRTAEDLLIHILDPNREVPPAYLNYTIATTDGQVVSGMIADESATSVTLKRAEGAVDVIPRNRIEALSSTGLSLMPENLETMLDPAAMADLLAYLASLRK